MKIKILALVLVLICGNVFSQENEVEIMINLLENEKISDINIDEDAFINSISKITDYCKSSFNDLPKTQKIGILIIAHKKGKPTYEIYSNPKIDNTLKDQTLKDLSKLKIDNTKLVDFPIFISINSTNNREITDFKAFTNPVKLKLDAYKKADLKTKLKLNKAYAINEALPILSAYQVIVNDKFVGVKTFGNLIQNANFNKTYDTQKATSLNTNYWRATLEMDRGNQLIPITKIYALVAQGEFDHAKKYIEILRPFSNPQTISNDYLETINYRLNLFYQDLEKEILKGISEHNKGNYKVAINIYNAILDIYPNSAWALYEKYYSENALKLKEDKISPEDKKDWDIAKVEIYKHNPLYHMDVRAKTGKDAYLLFRRQEIGGLFKNENEKLSDVFKYAEIASDLGIYDFAAQLFWLTATFDKDNSQKSIHNFLYCLDKLGDTQIKSNFKGDFESIFKAIEKEKQTKMEDSAIFKSMKN
ncbi:hypothetical protein [uncultured Psychroserpens sp.]|uniref:hypothetical protein n=1 Tax=uncultured Psychroserpens sp. TaxID=255436 RepID=UPI00261F8CDA|nr:hypothetical protein [uncultured Psychroserpens sp.]